MDIQHKITAYGLNKHDEATLKSFLKVLNLGQVPAWVYSDEDSAEIVIVDPEQEKGMEFIWSYQIGVHSEKAMVSVGENTSECQSLYSLTRPLRYDNLRKMFNELIDANGHLVDCVI
ncbi:MAG: hypothetical protein ABUK13_09270 [Gammaproteobacteria bacterium]